MRSSLVSNDSSRARSCAYEAKPTRLRRLRLERERRDRVNRVLRSRGDAEFYLTRAKDLMGVATTEDRRNRTIEEKVALGCAMAALRNKTGFTTDELSAAFGLNIHTGRHEVESHNRRMKGEDGPKLKRVISAISRRDDSDDYLIATPLSEHGAATAAAHKVYALEDAPQLVLPDPSYRHLILPFVERAAAIAETTPHEILHCANAPAAKHGRRLALRAVAYALDFDSSRLGVAFGLNADQVNAAIDQLESAMQSHDTASTCRDAFTVEDGGVDADKMVAAARATWPRQSAVTLPRSICRLPRGISTQTPDHRSPVAVVTDGDIQPGTESGTPRRR